MNDVPPAEPAAPTPLHALWRRWLAVYRPRRHWPLRLAHAASRLLLPPAVQRVVPGLSARLKITPSDRLAVVVTCGNRLTQLQQNLPSLLDQAHAAYQVVVSVYADAESTADYIRAHFANALRDKRLLLLETPAPRFNKARALNIAVAALDADYLLLIDVDCRFAGRSALRDILHQFNMQPYPLCSMTVWGMLLTRRDEFLALGGFDTTLSDGWAPDDFDYIARWVAHFRRPYACFAPDYLFTIHPAADIFLIRQRDRLHPRWIINTGQRQDEFDLARFAQTKFFARIGGLKPSKQEYFAATLEHFRRHSPVIDFVAAPPADNATPSG